MSTATKPVEEVAPKLNSFPPQTELTADSQSTLEGGALSIAVLGASGDLAKKKTFPALYGLFKQGFLKTGQVQIYGYARSSMSSEDLRDRIKGYLKTGDKDPKNAESDFLAMIDYIHGPYEGRDGYAKLQEALVKHENKTSGSEGPTRRLFYLALPPTVYPPVCKELRQYCMNGRGWTRVVVEKPFGKDLASAEVLSSQLAELFTEEQLYRIDHYLGKEVVQNLLVMRFANRFFVPLWNRDNIDNVQITFKEDFGTEGRGGYFDQYGIIRDIIQNHLMQVLCLLTMEKPVSLDPEKVRDEKVKVLYQVEPIREEEVVLGQYEGYLDDETVPKGSHTPTFASVVLRIRNERWDGVPFIMKAGKALESKKVEIRLQFKDTPGDIFKCEHRGRNEFVLRLQPSEAMYMKFTVKQPGLAMAAVQSELDLSYRERYVGVNIPEAYERLILDTVRGDQQHFVRRDELLAAWKIFTPLLHRIDEGKLTNIPYKQGSRGPPEADELAERMGYVRTESYVWVPPSLRGQ